MDHTHRRVTHPRISPCRSLQAQAESAIGPYELHDFSLYYFSRRGYRPAKVAFLACNAWSTAHGGGGSTEYSDADILGWLGVFVQRFFRTSQFKRSAVPNSPKVGSGGSLSPRGDWRAPADNRASPWLEELQAVKAWITRTDE